MKYEQEPEKPEIVTVRLDKETMARLKKLKVNISAFVRFLIKRELGLMK